MINYGDSIKIKSSKDGSRTLLPGDAPYNAYYEIKAEREGIANPLSLVENLVVSKNEAYR